MESTLQQEQQAVRFAEQQLNQLTNAWEWAQTFERSHMAVSARNELRMAQRHARQFADHLDAFSC